MTLIVSNLLIYGAQPGGRKIRDFIRSTTTCISVVSKVEVLGYHKLKDDERSLLESFFSIAIILEITSPVIEEAIRLRQIRKMTLGDSFIAATALVHDLTLATHNTEDFSWVPDLKLTDPSL